MKSTQCSDWGRGWGFGGLDHLGKLVKLSDTSYQWTGKRQGRHNNPIRKSYSITFDYIDGHIVNCSGSDLPDRRDIIEAIRILNMPEPVKRITKPKVEKHKTQLQLL